MEQGDLFSSEAQAVAGFSDIGDDSQSRATIKAKAKRDFILSPTWRSDINAIIARAILAGTHSPGGGMHVCGVCREWTDTIIHRNVQDGTPHCVECAARVGVKEARQILRERESGASLDHIEPAYVAPAAFNPFDELPPAGPAE